MAECFDAAVNVMFACAEQLCILLVRTNEAGGKENGITIGRTKFKG